MKQGFFYFIVIVLSIKCKVEPKEKNIVDFNKNPYMDAIYNSSSADHPNDSSHLAKISFDETEYNFPAIHEGDTVVHSFKFKNSGNARLLISDVNTSCGCTKPLWPKGFIRPADSGFIEIKFMTKDKPGEQEKIITVVANTKPNTTELLLKGYVKPKNSR